MSMNLEAAGALQATVDGRARRAGDTEEPTPRGDFLNQVDDADFGDLASLIWLTSTTPACTCLGHARHRQHRRHRPLHLTGDWDERRIDEALQQIRRAIELQPGLPIAFVALSQAQSRAGNLDAALAASQQACRLSPNDAECLYVLGAAHLQLGQIEPALVNLEQAMNRNPLPPAYLPALYATALWAYRHFEEAIRVADACLTRAPDFWRCRQDRIAALVELQRLPEARKEAALLLARCPASGANGSGRHSATRAAALRERRVTAARLVGIPDTPTVAQ